MNYFIDISTFSRFYALNDEDEEKPPPDLKSTSGQIEEQEIKKEKRRKQTPEKKDKTPLVDETMGSAPRKEKTSWPDWQFWKRSDGSSGPFGAFRKSAKSTGAFTFRKDVNDTVGIDKPEAKNEHASTGFALSVGQTSSGDRVQDAEIRGPVHANELEKDQPLVSYMKESNGSKHVVINMTKIETLASSRSGEASRMAGEMASTIMEEKNSQSRQVVNCVSGAQICAPSTDAGTRTSRNMSGVKTEETKKAPAQQTTNTEKKDLLLVPEGKHKNGAAAKIRNSRSKNGKGVQQQFSVVAPSVHHENKQTEVSNHKKTDPKKQENAAHNVRVEVEKPTRKGEPSLPAPSKQFREKIDEKPCSKQLRKEVDAVKPKGVNCCFKTIKSSVIPLPRLNPKEVAEKKLSDSKANVPAAKGACLEQGRLHTVLKKVNESWRPGSGNSTQNFSAPIQIQTTFPAQKAVPSQAQGNTKAVNNPAETRPLIAQKSENNAGKKLGRHLENAQNCASVTPGMVRANPLQKSTAVGTALQQNTGKTSNLSDSGKQQPSKAFGRQVNGQTEPSKHPNNSTIPTAKSPIMKDASTATPRPTAKVNAEVQFPEEIAENESLSASDVAVNLSDETESLLMKRPWDTERVLKMQVLLDEKQVEIGQLKDAGKRQREELRAFKQRCEELEEVIIQANMEGKPQLVIQINELTEIKNELLTEVTKLTVDIERERTNVKALKTELAEVKGQLNAARKKNGNLACQ